MAVALLILVSPLPRASAGRVEGSPPTLGAVTTLGGSGTGYITVRLPRALTLARDTPLPSAVTFGFGGSPVKIRHPENLVAIALMPDPPHEDGPALMAMHLPGRKPGNMPYLLVGPDPDAGYPDERLPAGLYRLYLVASGPTQVRFRLPGLTGPKLSLTPAVKAHHETRSFDVAGMPGTAVSPVHSAGATGTLRTEGTLFNATWFDGHAGGTVTAFGGCIYDGGAPSEIFYQTPSVCPFGTNATGILQSPPQVPTRFLSWGTARVPAGRWGLQSYYASASVPATGATVLLWLSDERGPRS